MKKHSEDFYKAAIKTTLKNTWDIRHPEVQGSVYPVFLADTPNGTTVCRFNDADIVFKNHKVSNLLRIYDIPAPQTRVRAYMDTWFETYDYCPDKTLYEYIKAGASRKQIFDAYKQTIDLQNQIARISPDEFNPSRGRYISDVYAISLQDKNYGPKAHLYKLMHPLFSKTGKLRLLHNDIQPKNILVDGNGTVSRLIDLDAVALCNDSFSVLMTLRRYPLDNYAEFMDYYEDTSGRLLNRTAIMAGLRILNTLHPSQQSLVNVFLRKRQR